MALLACPLAFGQSTPAATSWQKYPTAVPSSPLPPPPPLPGTSVGGASTPGSRVVVFTKPAGEVQPVQATAPVQKDDQKEPKAEDKLLKDDKLQAEKEAKLPTPPPADPFVLRTDDELAVELDKLRDYPTKLKEFRKQQDDYARELERFNQGVRKEKPEKPFLPQPIGEFVLQPEAFQPAAQVKVGYSPTQALLEPGYVVHRRMFFEEKNSERYGWDLGFAQPFVSTAYFAKDVLLWPSHLTSNLWERYDTSAGKCPPGSPVAYYLYPPNITLRGGLVNAGVVVGTVLLMP